MEQAPEQTLDGAHVYRLPRTMLRVIGIWPLDGGNVPMRLYVASFSLISATTAGIVHGFVNIRHLHVALLSFCPAVFELVTWIKLMLFWYHAKTMADLLRTLLACYRRDCAQELRAIYEKNINHGIVMNLGLAFFSFSTGSLFGMTPIVRNLYLLVNDRPIVRELSFQAYYPCIDPLADPYYIFCFLHTTLGGAITTVTFPGLDGVFMTICTLISTQFQVMSHQLRNAFNRIDPLKSVQAIDNGRIGEELIACIKYQLELFGTVDCFIGAFASITLIHFISTATVIGLASINLLTSASDNRTVLYVFYIGCVVLQAFLFAYFGHRIVEHSFQFHVDCYTVQWYRLNGKNMKLILMMIMRSQRSAQMRVPFFDVDLPVFSKIMTKAGSYVTLLKKLLDS